MQKKRILNLNKKVKLCLVACVVATSLAVAGVTAYLNAERLVSYEISDSEVTKGVTPPTPAYDTALDIPECTEYTMYLIDGKICVYSDGVLLCSESFTDTSRLTSGDLAELEEDGISFAARPDVIEMLNYLNS